MQETKPGVGLFRRIMAAVFGVALVGHLGDALARVEVPRRKMQYMADRTRNRRNRRRRDFCQGSRPKHDNNRNLLRGGFKRNYSGASYSAVERLEMVREAERRAKAAAT